MRYCRRPLPMDGAATPAGLAKLMMMMISNDSNSSNDGQFTHLVLRCTDRRSQHVYKKSSRYVNGQALIVKPWWLFNLLKRSLRWMTLWTLPVMDDMNA